MMPRTFAVARARTACFTLVATLFTALNVCAQTSTTGSVVVDGAVIWRADVTVPAATAPLGTQLEVTAQSSRWYEVVVPASLGGHGERGIIARSQVRIAGDLTRIPAKTLRGDPPTEATGRTDSARRTNLPAPPKRTPIQGLLSINGLFNATSNDFRETVLFRESAEQGQFETAYTVKSMKGFSAGAGAMLLPTFGIGASFERSTTSTPAAFSGAIPHPFFFDRPRNISASISGLTRDELALHGELRAVWPVHPRVQLALVGGPSLFRVSQQILSDFTYTQSYPYDEAQFATSDTLTATKTRIGFNIGGDAAFFFTRQIGIGAKVSMSRTTVDLPIDDDREVEVKAGGLTTGVGLRLRF
jgi:hypothetical protein